jgi:hypothetical protein
VVGAVLHTMVTGHGDPLLYAHGQFARLVPIPDTTGELDETEVVEW